MPDFSKIEILKALKLARNRIYGALDNFSWIEIEQVNSLASLFLDPAPDRPKINVRALRPEIFENGQAINQQLAALFDTDPVTIKDLNGRTLETTISFERGVSIAPLINTIFNVVPTLPPAPLSKTIFRAGDPCFNAKGNCLHGTVGAVLQEFHYSRNWTTPLSFTHKPAGPENGGLISNNHVIARSDLGAVMDSVRLSRYYDDVANLKAFAPLNDLNVHVDLAVATLKTGVHSPSSPEMWGRVRGMPGQKISGFATVPPAGTEVRKSGASSDVTSGKIEIASGPGLINVRGRSFEDVYRMPKGFGTYGDSGSLVLEYIPEGETPPAELKAVGMLSWGDSTANVYDDMPTYFWPFIGAGFDATWSLIWSVDGTKRWRWEPNARTGGAPKEI